MKLQDVKILREVMMLKDIERLMHELGEHFEGYVIYHVNAALSRYRGDYLDPEVTPSGWTDGFSKSRWLTVSDGSKVTPEIVKGFSVSDVTGPMLYVWFEYNFKIRVAFKESDVSQSANLHRLKDRLIREIGYMSDRPYKGWEQDLAIDNKLNLYNLHAKPKQLHGADRGTTDHFVELKCRNTVWANHLKAIYTWKLLKQGAFENWKRK